MLNTCVKMLLSKIKMDDDIDLGTSRLMQRPLTLIIVVGWGSSGNVTRSYGVKAPCT